MNSNRLVFSKFRYAVKCPLTLVSVFLALVMTGFPASANVEYSTWVNILQRYVNDDGYVNYQELLENRESFDQYIKTIETISPENNPELFANRSEELAYYINSYNALVFNGVLNRGPEQESVWRGLISGLNFFVRMDIVIGGKTTNLKNLEDDVIRAQYKDPRIHAALNCASIGCPRIIREPYVADKLEQQLDQAMTEFLNGSMHVVLDTDKERLGISKIFDWYEEDFLDYEVAHGNTANDEQTLLIDYINRYRSDKAQIPNHYEIYILKYDKRINSQ